MTYAIIKCINGNFSIHAEGITDIDTAKVNFHNLCAALWNEPTVDTACVMITDENLDTVGGYKEFISHAAAVEVEEL